MEPAPLKLKLSIAGIGGVVSTLAYILPNHLPLRPVQPLPWTHVDALVPFWPETVWLYLSDYALVFTDFLWCRDRSEVRRFSLGYFSLLFVSAAVHFAWPTVYPRDHFPVVGDDLTIRALSTLRLVDMPTSCMPSLHVACSCFAALSLWRHPKWVFATWSTWAALITVSTLTAKQHYAVDVAAGAGLALLSWAASNGTVLTAQNAKSAPPHQQATQAP